VASQASRLPAYFALLDTVGGGVVKGYWDKEQAQSSFQSQLILKALEPKDGVERIKSLQFLVKINLIQDPTAVAGINQVAEEGPGSVPQFAPPNARFEPGVRTVPSVKSAFVAAMGTTLAKDARLALVGIKIRSGQVIASMAPLYASLSPDFKLGHLPDLGQSQGGGNGQGILLVKDGYFVTGLYVQRGTYFGRDEVVHLQVVWRRLTPQGLDSAEEMSDIFGSGEYVGSLQPTLRKRADPGHFISDYSLSISAHQR
jgi:hypothetical protein